MESEGIFELVELDESELALINGGAGRCKVYRRPRMCKKKGQPSYVCGSSKRTVCQP